MRGTFQDIKTIKSDSRDANAIQRCKTRQLALPTVVELLKQTHSLSLSLPHFAAPGAHFTFCHNLHFLSITSINFPAYLNPQITSQMLSQFNFLSQSSKPLPFSPVSFHNQTLTLRQNDTHCLPFSPALNYHSVSLKPATVSAMASNSNLSNHTVTSNGIGEPDLDRFADVANKLADAAGEVIRKYFRKKFEIIDKEDLSKSYSHIFILFLLFYSYFNWSVLLFW